MENDIQIDLRIGNYRISKFWIRKIENIKDRISMSYYDSGTPPHYKK